MTISRIWLTKALGPCLSISQAGWLAILAYDGNKQDLAHDGLDFSNDTLAYNDDKQNPAHKGLGALPVLFSGWQALLQVTWGLVCQVSILLLLL